MRKTLLPLLFAALLGAAAAAGDSEQAVVANEEAVKCPIAEKCPYYQHAKESGAAGSEHAGCPLKDKGCPYYAQHKKDHDVKDMLVSDNHECPLKGKCSFYQDVKDGKADSVDFSGHKCPLDKKCPYYDEIKKNGTHAAVDCPVLHACPHFSQKDLKSQPHPGGYAHGHKHDASKCPYMNKGKEGAKMEEVKDEL
ncbi:hypothetical protein HK097_001858 [Rhizophlyctis rosea]|uniref:Uncharacterized protein n=1 Tax=Rhizophlyctis rosea TaxID=64517 RepID=A0AAD5S664_9FUNG|nr:hypothetical protein HK097_001858 [Rhizophlyctis rosea]